MTNHDENSVVSVWLSRRSGILPTIGKSGREKCVRERAAGKEDPVNLLNVASYPVGSIFVPTRA
jgi:hypothetical protein